MCAWVDNTFYYLCKTDLDHGGHEDHALLTELPNQGNIFIYQVATENT